MFLLLAAKYEGWNSADFDKNIGILYKGHVLFPPSCPECGDYLYLVNTGGLVGQCSNCGCYFNIMVKNSFSNLVPWVEWVEGGYSVG